MGFNVTEFFEELAKRGEEAILQTITYSNPALAPLTFLLQSNEETLQKVGQALGSRYSLDDIKDPNVRQIVEEAIQNPWWESVIEGIPFVGQGYIVYEHYTTIKKLEKYLKEHPEAWEDVYKASEILKSENLKDLAINTAFQLATLGTSALLSFTKAPLSIGVKVFTDPAKAYALSQAVEWATSVAVGDVAKQTTEIAVGRRESYDPLETISAVGTAGIIGGLGGYAYYTGKLPIPKIGKVETDEGKWAGLYIQKGRGPEAKPIIGITKTPEGTKITLGTPELPMKTPQMPKSPIETAILTKSLEKYYKDVPEELTKLRTGQEMMKIMYSNEVAKQQISLRDVLRQSKNLHDVADEVFNWIQKQKDILVYGSTAQKMQMGEFMTRQTADIDIVVPNAEQKAKELLSILKQKLGNQVRINPNVPTLIERYVPGKGWVHMIDIHEKPTTYLSLFGGDDYIGYGFKPHIPQKSPEGFWYMRLSEQAVRKGVSSLTPFEEGLHPEWHRLKDVRDFIEIAKFYVEKLKNINPSKANTLAKLIEQFEKASEPLLKQQLAQEISKQLGESEIVVFMKSLPSYLGTAYSPFPLTPSIASFVSNFLPKETKQSKPSKTADIPEDIYTYYNNYKEEETKPSPSSSKSPENEKPSYPPSKEEDKGKPSPRYKYEEYDYYNIPSPSVDIYYSPLPYTPYSYSPVFVSSPTIPFYQTLTYKPSKPQEVPPIAPVPAILPFPGGRGAVKYRYATKWIPEF